MTQNPFILDVREDLHAGRQPFPKIMAAVAALATEQELLIIAPFEPIPLLSMLAQQGYRHQSYQTATGEWQVCCSRDRRISAMPSTSRKEEALNADETAGAQEDVRRCARPAPDTLTLDARGLEPPQPLVNILEAVAGLPPGAELRVHTDRRPMHLYPQLEARGFIGESQEQSDGSFITQIRPR